LIFPSPFFSLETSFGLGIYRYLDKQPWFAAANYFGRPLEDHWWGFYCTGHDIYLVSSDDFSGFDISQHWENVRQYALAGIKKSTVVNQIDKHRWGPHFKNISEVVDFIWNKYREAWFKVGFTKVMLNQLLSGEFITLPFNTITNLVNAEYTEGLLIINGIMKKIALRFTSLLGDDAVKVYEIISNICHTDDEDLIREMMTIIIKGAADNGFKLSETKSALRRHWYEYQKVAVLWGYHIPRVQVIQLICGEKINTSVSTLEVMASYANFIITFISRGGQPIFCDRLIKASWIVKRTLVDKTGSVKGGKKTYYEYPYYALYVPRSLGGIGRFPGILLGASIDALIAILAEGAVRDAINRSAHAIKIPRSDFRRMAAKDLLNSGQLDKGIKFQKANMDKGRVKAAKEASDTLKHYNINLEHFPSYAETVEQQIGFVLQNSTNFATLDYDNKSNDARLLRMVTPWPGNDLLDEKYPWLHTVTLQKTDTLDKLHDVCPIAGLQVEMADTLNYLGISRSTAGGRMNPTTLFEKLTADPLFPKYLRPEFIIELISRPEILMNQAAIQLVLVRMGASMRDATNVASNVHNNMDLFLFFSNSKNFSANDDLGRWINFTAPNLKRVVDVPVVGPNHFLTQMLNNLAMTYAYVSAPMSPTRVKLNVEASQLMIMDTMIIKTYRQITTAMVVTPPAHMVV
jgi:hypothetical protein